MLVYNQSRRPLYPGVEKEAQVLFLAYTFYKCLLNGHMICCTRSKVAVLRCYVGNGYHNLFTIPGSTFP